MNSITYRKIEKSDYEIVKDMINKAFKFEGFIDNIDVLHKSLNIYLHSCLSATTFSSVAIKDGHVIGFILGSAKNKNTLLNFSKHTLVLGYSLLSLLLKSKEDKKSLTDYKKILAAYDKLMENRKNDFEGCIELFIVSDECQGLGVGKKLVSQLISYMKESSVSNLYLYSDSNCNYGFYDSQGFNQTDSIPVPLGTSEKSIILDVYLYSYNLNSVKL